MLVAINAVKETATTTGRVPELPTVPSSIIWARMAEDTAVLGSNMFGVGWSEERGNRGVTTYRTADWWHCVDITT